MGHFFGKCACDLGFAAYEIFGKTSLNTLVNAPVNTSVNTPVSTSVKKTAAQTAATAK